MAPHAKKVNIGKKSALDKLYELERVASQLQRTCHVSAPSALWPNQGALGTTAATAPASRRERILCSMAVSNSSSAEALPMARLGSTTISAAALHRSHPTGSRRADDTDEVVMLAHHRPAHASSADYTQGVRDRCQLYATLDKDWASKETEYNREIWKRQTDMLRVQQARWERRIARLEQRREWEKDELQRIKEQCKQLSARVQACLWGTPDTQASQPQKPGLFHEIGAVQLDDEQAAHSGKSSKHEQSSSPIDLLSSSEDEAPQRDSADVAAEQVGVISLMSSSDDEREGAAQDSMTDADSAASTSSSEAEPELDLNGPQRVLALEHTERYHAIVKDAHGTDAIVTHPKASVEIDGKDFHTMAPSRWLADPCINMYMALLQDRDEMWFHAPELKKPKCLFMTSHFVAKLCQEGGYKYENVQRWTAPRKLRRIKVLHYHGIKDVDKIVFPVHLGNHWTCAVLNIRDQQLEYYDSLNGEDRYILQCLERWLVQDYMDKYNEEAPEKYQVSQWKRVINPPKTPQQQNGHDCGVFAMMCANYVSADMPFDYGQREVHSFFRAMCALECHSMRLRQLL